MIKYMIRKNDDPEERPTALVYDPFDEVGKLGGHISEMTIMEAILSKCFGFETVDKKGVKPIRTQRNKMRYELKMTRQAFAKGMKVVNDGYFVTEVKTIGRLMS